MLISAILLASTSPAIVRQEILPDPDTKSGQTGIAQACTRGREWCVRLDIQSDDGHTSHSITVRQASGQSAQTTIDYADASAVSGTGLWTKPVSYRTANGRSGLLFGIVTTRSEGYSGGGAYAETLQLLRAETDASGALAIMPMDDPVPLAASVMIRACFSEQDMKLRRNICHDEYDLTVTLKLRPKLVHDLPAFTYESKASVTPGFAARDSDNSDAGRLKAMKAADFKTRSDTRCSFTRPLEVDARRARYVFDAPDCSNYGPGEE